MCWNNLELFLTSLFIADSFMSVHLQPPSNCWVQNNPLLLGNPLICNTFVCNVIFQVLRVLFLGPQNSNQANPQVKSPLLHQLKISTKPRVKLLLPPRQSLLVRSFMQRPLLLLVVEVVVVLGQLLLLLRKHLPVRSSLWRPLLLQPPRLSQHHLHPQRPLQRKSQQQQLPSLNKLSKQILLV